MLQNYRTNYSGSLLQIQKQYTGWAKNGATDYDHNSTIRYDTRYYFNVRSKADISQLNLPHGTDN